MIQEYPTTWQEKQSQLVNGEVKELLDVLSIVPGFRDIVQESIVGLTPKAAKVVGHNKPWYLLPLVVCESVSGKFAPAVPAGAALQLFMAAGQVFDDIEDADALGSLSARYGSAIATNAATTLLILAEKAVTRLKREGVTDDLIVRVMDAINSFYTEACCGQHKDLSFTVESTTSEEAYLLVASMKSASTIECACHIGALVATKKEELLAQFTLFGHNLGMVSQIANDIQGITSGRDIIKQRVTLPVIYALTHTEGECYNQLALAFNKKCESTLDVNQIRDLLFDSGGIFYAMIRMDLYKQKALDILLDLDKARVNTERLKSFLG